MGSDGINERLRLGSGLESNRLCGKERFCLACVVMREKLLVKEQLAKINLVQNEA